MSSEKIRWRLLVPLTLGGIAILFACILGVRKLQEDHLHDAVKSQTKSVHAMFHLEINEESGLMHSMICFLEDREDIREAWLDKNRDGLYEVALPIFERLREDHRITHFYFIGLDRTCFLRVHNRPRHGDFIDRYTMNNAFDTQQTATGIELGAFGTFTLRVVHPWRVNGELIGYIELGQEIDHITDELHNALGGHIAFLLEKAHVDRQTWEEGLRMTGQQGDWELLDKHIVVSSTMQTVPKEIERFLTPDHSEHSDVQFGVATGGTSYRAAFSQLVDAGGRDVGDIVVLRDITVSTAAARSMMLRLVIISAIVGSMLFALGWIFLGRIERDLVEARERLETEVEERELIASALFESEEKTRAILDNAPDTILDVDRDGTIRFANHPLPGMNPEDIAGTCIYDHVDPDHRDLLESAVEFVLEASEATSAEFALKAEGGDAVSWRSARIGVLRQGSMTGAVTMILTDVTERRRQRSELGKHLSELERFNRLAVGRELKMIELKTEVNALLRELSREERYRVETPATTEKANASALD